MRKKSLIICTALILLFIILGLILYTPTIFQEGNPLPIIKGIVSLQFSNERLVYIDSQRYITKAEGGNDVIISSMKSNGWKFKDQFGSGFIFEKQGNSLTIECRQYSKYLKIWKIPRLE